MGVLSSSALTPDQALAQLKEKSPLVQCITNSVVTGFTANFLLALGAAPAMVDIPDEAGIFAGVADGVLVNLGTPNQEQRSVVREAASSTERWVLDPVAIGVLPVRTALAAELLKAKPAIIRGNASEILALAGTGAGGRGVDSTASTESALDAAAALARSAHGVVAVSGAVDVITDGNEVVKISGGSELLTKVTGGGCALGASMAAFLGVCNPLSAAVAASVVHAKASEYAAQNSQGPGSFAVAFLDAVAKLSPDELIEPGRLNREPLIVNQKDGSR